VTATVSPIICPDLGIDEPHYLGDEAALIAGCSRRTLVRRARATRERRNVKVKLTPSYFHGLVCYPVAQIHDFRDELKGRGDL
jgi:hypothetical protein